MPLQGNLTSRDIARMALTPINEPSPWEIFWDGDAAWWVYLIVSVSAVAIVASIIAAIAVHRKHANARLKVQVDGECYKLRWKQRFTPQIPKREGYAFRGWYLDSACSIPWDSRKPIKCDTILFTKWEKE